MDVVPLEIDRPSDVVPLPDLAALELVPVQFEVMTPARLPDGDDWARFALDGQNYENLARNLAETLAWIEKARWQLDQCQGTME